MLTTPNSLKSGICLLVDLRVCILYRYMFVCIKAVAPTAAYMTPPMETIH